MACVMVVMRQVRNQFQRGSDDISNGVTCCVLCRINWQANWRLTDGVTENFLTAWLKANWQKLTAALKVHWGWHCMHYMHCIISFVSFSCSGSLIRTWCYTTTYHYLPYSSIKEGTGNYSGASPACFDSRLSEAAPARWSGSLVLFYSESNLDNWSVPTLQGPYST